MLEIPNPSELDEVKGFNPATCLSCGETTADGEYLQEHEMAKFQDILRHIHSWIIEILSILDLETENNKLRC